MAKYREFESNYKAFAAKRNQANGFNGNKSFRGGFDQVTSPFTSENIEKPEESMESDRETLAEQTVDRFSEFDRKLDLPPKQKPDAPLEMRPKFKYIGETEPDASEEEKKKKCRFWMISGSLFVAGIAAGIGYSRWRTTGKIM